jgi:hypothetical protein
MTSCALNSTSGPLYITGMAKYRFRKMYFVCRDKDKIVINPNILMTQAYQSKETAEVVCKQEQRPFLSLWEDNTSPPLVHTVERFYLVHEKLYEEILKKYMEE